MKKAFTMLELLVVIGIIALLAAFLVPAMSGSSESAKATKCLANMHQLAMGVQSCAMSSAVYPLAGSTVKYKEFIPSRGTKALHGWIGWSADTASGSYISPYSNDSDARFFSLTNGRIWKAVSRSREVYVCPSHRDVTRKRLGVNDRYGPCWSYVMNARFGWKSSETPRFYDYYGESHESCRSASKTLLFAELPFLTLKEPYTDIQTPEFNSAAAKNNDPVLQYKDCTGGGDEVIGFNHYSGKRLYYGHVAFADGHTEKFRLPQGATVQNLKDLTKWLCKPECEDVITANSRKRRDFDVVLRKSGGGEKYEQDMSSSK